jgi:hypothetical protein
MTVPVLLALFSISVNLVLILVQPVKFLRNLFPVFDGFPRALLIESFVHNFFKQL